MDARKLSGDVGLVARRSDVTGTILGVGVGSCPPAALLLRRGSPTGGGQPHALALPPVGPFSAPSPHGADTESGASRPGLRPGPGLGAPSPVHARSTSRATGSTRPQPRVLSGAPTPRPQGEPWGGCGRVPNRPGHRAQFLGGGPPRPPGSCAGCLGSYPGCVRCEPRAPHSLT